MLIQVVGKKIGNDEHQVLRPNTAAAAAAILAAAALRKLQTLSGRNCSGVCGVLSILGYSIV